MAKIPAQAAGAVPLMVANRPAMVKVASRAAEILLVPGKTVVLNTDPLYLALPGFFDPLSEESY